MVGGDSHANLVFDLAVPFDCKKSEKSILSQLKERISELDPALGVIVTVERQTIDS